MARDEGAGAGSLLLAFILGAVSGAAVALLYAPVIGQIGLLVAAGMLARRINRLAGSVERELKPLAGHLNAIGRDASRAVSLATAQVERVDRLFADVMGRAEATLGTLQAAVVG